MGDKESVWRNILLHFPIFSVLLVILAIHAWFSVEIYARLITFVVMSIVGLSEHYLTDVTGILKALIISSMATSSFNAGIWRGGGDLIAMAVVKDDRQVTVIQLTATWFAHFWFFGLFHFVTNYISYSLLFLTHCSQLVFLSPSSLNWVESTP